MPAEIFEFQDAFYKGNLKMQSVWRTREQKENTTGNTATKANFREQGTPKKIFNAIFFSWKQGNMEPTGRPRILWGALAFFSHENDIEGR